jgi:hypothetical protein
MFKAEDFTNCSDLDSSQINSANDVKAENTDLVGIQVRDQVKLAAKMIDEERVKKEEKESSIR